MKETAKALCQTVDEFLKDTVLGINWENKADMGKWTNKEIIGHLIDSAQINLQRFIRCTYEEGFKLIYHQDECVQLQGYIDVDVTSLLKLWELLNRQICRVLQNYPPDRIHIKCDTGRYEQSIVSVELIAADYVRHLRHHLLQLG
jgi:hypothetical protein